MRMLHRAVGDSAISELKEIMSLAANPSELSKVLAQLESKMKAAQDAEQKLNDKLAIVSKMEAEWFPKSERLKSLELALAEKEKVLDQLMADYREKYRSLAAVERDVESKKEALKAQEFAMKADFAKQEEFIAAANQEASEMKSAAIALSKELAEKLAKINSIMGEL